MILIVLRALFILLMAAVGWFFIKHSEQPFGNYTWLSMMVSVVVGVLIVCIDILSPRKKLAVFSGTFFGLVVGISIAYALSFVVQLLVDQYMPQVSPSDKDFQLLEIRRDALVQFANLVIGSVCCYLAISFILQTKDDFRFVIPYVEFRKQTKGQRPLLLDTNILIDGRINDIATTGILESQLVVPQFVLTELQSIADSSDRLKRNRGRRGLDILAKLQNNDRIEVILYESITHEDEQPVAVDQRLMLLAKELNARVLTNDLNLNKVAMLNGVEVININDLAQALKPVVLPGEKMSVRLLKPGEEAGQGVGYLDDGTMVVVEQGRQHINEEVEFSVTSVLQTSAGRMIFGRMGGEPAMSAGPQRRMRGRSDP